jgi:hypothetical protein
LKKADFLYVFFLFSLISFGQTDNIDSKKVIGKYIGGKTLFEKTNIKIKKSNSYKRREFSEGGVSEMSVGKWAIQKDTLILTEKFYKQKTKNHSYFFTFYKKTRSNSAQARKQITKLVMNNGRWMELGESKFAYNRVFIQYVLKGGNWKPLYKEPGC